MPHDPDMTDDKPPPLPPAPRTEPDSGTGPRSTVPPVQKPGEIGGPRGPEPTRYGDWEVGGRCSDF